MKRPFLKLRVRMMEFDMELEQLARVIKRSRTTASARLNGHEGWNLDEVYAICDELEIPYDQIYLYFPPTVAEDPKKKKKQV